MHQPASESNAHPTGDDLSREIASILRLDKGGLGEDDNLFELGLDSFAVLRLAAEWRRRGFVVTFEELVDEPTLRRWRVLLMQAAEPKYRRRDKGHG